MSRVHLRVCELCWGFPALVIVRAAVGVHRRMREGGEGEVRVERVIMRNEWGK